MRVLGLLFSLLFIAYSLRGQNSALDKKIKKYNKESVPYVSVQELANTQNVVLLDTREKKEYAVSHIENAIWVGYNTFNKNGIATLIKNKATPIIVYCSIGVRSENIGEILIKMGYTNVKNLYGGIFDWKNKNYPVFTNTNKQTEEVHAYDKEWGKLLEKGKKIYR